MVEEGEEGSEEGVEGQKMKYLHENMSRLSESLVDLRDNYEDLEKEEGKFSKILPVKSNIRQRHRYKDRQESSSRMYGVETSPEK